jgi:hypothetical protein
MAARPVAVDKNHRTLAQEVAAKYKGDTSRRQARRQGQEGGVGVAVKSDAAECAGLRRGYQESRRLDPDVEVATRACGEGPRNDVGDRGGRRQRSRRATNRFVMWDAGSRDAQQNSCDVDQGGAGDARSATRLDRARRGASTSSS